MRIYKTNDRSELANNLSLRARRISPDENKLAKAKFEASSHDKQIPTLSSGCLFIGGEGEIRTHGGIAPSTVFKTAALNRSATSPYIKIMRFENSFILKILKGQEFFTFFFIKITYFIKNTLFIHLKYDIIKTS